MPYVLQRVQDGAFVAAPGAPSSYTLDLTKARTFSTIESALREKCDNESIVPVDALIRRPE